MIKTKVCKRTRKDNREIRHLMYGENAYQSIGKIEKGLELYGLTKGQFSIINIIEEILRQTGQADVLISTWTAAGAEIKKAEEFINNSLINKLHFIVDRSFETRQPKYFKILKEKFGECISTTNSHAKFVLIHNNDWNIVIRTSMNLNENKRLENFEISDDKVLFEYLTEICKDIMKVEYSYFTFKKLGENEKYKKYMSEGNFTLDLDLDLDINL